MTAWRLIARSLVHYRRTHAAVATGAAVATAVLVGALLVGASVRQTLRTQAWWRIGSVQHALIGGDRFFGDDLGERLARPLSPMPTRPGHAAAIVAPAAAARPDGAARVNAAQIIGVDERFWTLAPDPATSVPLSDGEVAVNVEAARRLDVTVGQDVVVRIDRLGGLPRDAVLGEREDTSVALRLRVTAIVSDRQFGRFALAVSPEPAANLFVSRRVLAEALGRPGQANLLLSAYPWRDEHLTERVLQLSDLELMLRPAAGGGQELVSSRVFLDDAAAEAARRVDPQAMGVLTYFVNSLRCGERATPYSTVAALSQPNVLFDGLRDDQIAINDWLAEDLDASEGDAIELRYFVIDEANRLSEATATFEVAKVVRMHGPAGLASDATLMPAFPGLHDAAHCRDWTPGVPVDLARIRAKDEAYWEKHRGTPKAFVTLAAGQRLWSNRFGNLTAIRMGEAARAEQILTHLDAARLGMSFVDVRTPALAAATGGTDFAALFLGLSLFLIAAALLLTALLFAFNLEQRASETGVLRAVGWRPGQVRLLLLGEATILAAIGGALGAVLGVGFTAAILRLLSGAWRGAVAGAAIELATPPTTVLGGVAAGAAVTLASLAWVARRMARRPVVALLGGDANAPTATAPGRWLAVAMGTACALGATMMLTLVPGLGSGGQARANATFAAGGLLLLAGVSALAALLGGRGGAATTLSSASLAWRGAARRRGRSLAVAGLLACGLFLVLAVGATQLQPPHDPARRDSGTGGFAWYGRSSLPLLHDLNSPRGREALGLDDDDMRHAVVVPLRVRDGDDASCLNLNRAQKPRLVGVDAEALASRGAFAFITPGATWRVLDDDLGPEVLPGVADRNTLMWGLGAAVGDVVRYNDERGEPFDVKIVAAIDNSVLQGELIIAERRFVERYPSVSGWRAMLVDGPPSQGFTATLSRAMDDLGLELTPTVERLTRFNEVENTYRLVFQSLGALGLLLGCVAVGAVVMRNVLERRAELAILAAVGFTPRRVRRLVMLEHAALVTAGVFVGTVAATTAAAGGGIVSLAAVTIVIAVAGSALLWVGLASHLAVRGSLIDALRSE